MTPESPEYTEEHQAYSEPTARELDILRERDEARAELKRYKLAVDAVQAQIEVGLRSVRIADVYCSLHDIERLLKRAALAQETATPTQPTGGRDE